MPTISIRRLQAIAATLCLLAFSPALLLAGGAKYVAGGAFFDANVVGQPLHWASGQLRYVVDQGPLNSSVDHASAVAMVDAAAALWSAVPTAAVALSRAGELAEDVSGANIAVNAGALTAPADILPTALTTPGAVVFDTDGAVIDALYGAGASAPESCQSNGVLFELDGVQSNATFTHGLMFLNGRCAQTDAQIVMLRFQLERAFGRMLGLDFSQVNPGAQLSATPGALEGWPLMQPSSGLCAASGGPCLPNPDQLRTDDIAALNRLYPVTAGNQAQWPGKLLTAAHTVSIQGIIRFRSGAGMQGVNIVARPRDAAGNPLYQYTATAVSGALFRGQRATPVTSALDAQGQPYARWGSEDTALEGRFDLSALPLPPGMSSADYEISFEAIDAKWIEGNAVGPYVKGSPLPSGALAPVMLTGLAPGQARSLAIDATDSAPGDNDTALGGESAPRPLPPGGMWFGRLGAVGQCDWFEFPMRAGRLATVVTEALDEQGQPSNRKARPAIGAWRASDAPGSAPVGASPGLNGWSTGGSWLQINSPGEALVRIAVCDERGDGRPDYSYRGWMLYADTVWPGRLPLTGGPIVVRGSGFRPLDTMLVGGRPAQITSITPNEITAIAPAGVSSGTVDIEIDDEAGYTAMAILSGGLSYEAGNGDALTLTTAPSGAVPIGAPLPFTVRALDAGLTPAGGLVVTFRRLSGAAALGCGAASCTATTSGDGLASISLTALDSGSSVVVASLSNGASVQTVFYGGSTPQLAAYSANTLSVAAGAAVNWPVQVVALLNGAPAPGRTVVWTAGAGVSLAGGGSTTDANGLAAQTLAISNLSKGQSSVTKTCINGTTQCVSFTVRGARPEYAQLVAVSGGQQSLSSQETPAQIVARLYDMNGRPLAGGQASLTQSLYAWAPPCAGHGRCAAAPLLATRESAASSALDGLLVFSPLSMPGVATNLSGVIASGEQATLEVQIERYP